MKLKRIQLTIAAAFVSSLNVGCKEETNMNIAKNKIESFSPKGEKGPAENFTGNAIRVTAIGRWMYTGKTYRRK